jgi:hypothetical protein
MQSNEQKLYVDSVVKTGVELGEGITDFMECGDCLYEGTNSGVAERHNGGIDKIH